MRKKIVKALLLIPMLVAMVVFAGCGKDNQAESKEKNLDMSLSIFNSGEGKSKEWLNSNEPIIFQFIIRTSSNLMLASDLKSDDLIVGDDFFSVYTEDGKLLRAPQMENLSIEVMETAKEVYVIRYLWDSMFFEKGNYYTEFNVRYNSTPGQKEKHYKTETFKKSFEIK